MTVGTKCLAIQNSAGSSLDYRTVKNVPEHLPLPANGHYFVDYFYRGVKAMLAKGVGVLWPVKQTGSDFSK